MPYDITDPAAAHRLQLEGREKLTVSGVEDVERFDETGIVMATSAGLLTVTGEGLHIGQLSRIGKHAVALVQSFHKQLGHEGGFSFSSLAGEQNHLPKKQAAYDLVQLGNAGADTGQAVDVYRFHVG